MLRAFLCGKHDYAGPDQQVPSQAVSAGLWGHYGGPPGFLTATVPAPYTQSDPEGVPGQVQNDLLWCSLVGLSHRGDME